MLKVFLEFSCYVCGNKTTHESSLCDNCRSKSHQIKGDNCSICGIPLISEKSICLRCRKMDYSFDRNISLFVYAGMDRDIFYQYKFRKHKRIGLWYSYLLAEKIKKDFRDYILVPSPYRYFKKIKKGWDQVEFIMKVLNTKYSLKSESLLNRKAGKDQKKLDVENRQRNLRGNICFIKKKYDIKDKNILFVDDVFTTGATADECSRVLKEHGALKVVVLTIAID